MGKQCDGRSVVSRPIHMSFTMISSFGMSVDARSLSTDPTSRKVQCEGSQDATRKPPALVGGS
jgi:hypothetical protein